MENKFIQSQLLQFLNESSTSTMNATIALGMLKNFRKIPTLTIYELAELCYVSPASIHRFVKRLGFKGYAVFKSACKDDIGIDVDYSNSVLKATEDDIKPLFEKYTHNVQENLAFNLENIDYQQLIRICDCIYKADDVVFLGLEFAMIIGKHFQKKMAECNKYIYLPEGVEHQKRVIDELSETKSVAIIASLELGYFYRCEEIIQALKEKNIKIIAITMDKHSKLLRDVDEVIICNKYNSETEGRISLLHILELILMMYFINYR